MYPRHLRSVIWTVVETLLSGSCWPGLLDEKTVRKLWRQNGLKRSVADIYIRVIYVFGSYCRLCKVDPLSGLTAAGAERFRRWHLRTQKLKLGFGPRVRSALRAYAWALSANGFCTPIWVMVRPERDPPIVSAYLRHAGEHRGIGQNTIARERAMLREFIHYMKPFGGWRNITLSLIDQYLLALSKRLAPKTLGRVACGIRGLLRFLFSTRRSKHDLSVLVVAPVRRTHDRPPRALPWPLIKKILRCIETNTAMGARDQAQFLLMSAYGMGGAEVLQLRLDDIDWRLGRLRITRQKTKNVTWLPLLPEVGRALACYIRRFRPRPSAASHVFLSMRMPHQPFTTSSVLRYRVRELAKRAGLSGRVSGTHLFRHSHATRHVILGTSAKTLGDILGHRDPETTSIYTRAALRRLRCLALPVPK